MCAIGKCGEVWVAIHGISGLILAVGGKGSAGKRRAHAEAKKRQAIYGPPGPIPTNTAKCRPMLKSGPAHDRIMRVLACTRRGGGQGCFTGAAANPRRMRVALMEARNAGIARRHVGILGELGYYAKVNPRRRSRYETNAPVRLVRKL